MRRFLGIIAVFFIMCSVSNAEDRRIDTSKLVIMSLNAEFLWDGVEPEEGRVDFPWKNSQCEAEEHMKRVANLIIVSNPDIVNLIEVENIEALNTFNDKFLKDRGYMPYLIKGKDSYTGEDVALLTRIDPEGDSIARDDRTAQIGAVKKSVSKNYYAKMTVNNRKLALIGIHFLAQPNREDRRLQREAQAEVIRRLAEEQAAAGYEVIVMGDFNDYDGEEACRDHIDSMPITNVLQIVKSMDTGNPSDDLINAASFLPKANRYTALYDRNDNGKVDCPEELTSIDHILVSPGLKSAVELVEIPHAHDPFQVTDHYPVVVHLKLADTPSLAPATKIWISGLLPNPEGNETQNEEITIKNLGLQATVMAGWTVRDLSGKTWVLDELATISPGEEKTVKRNGQKMALNNTGDTIELIDPSGKIMQTVTYHKAEEGEIIKPSDE